MQITPAMLDKDAHKAAHLAWQKALRECDTVECESDHEGIFLAAYLNALLASGKAKRETRQDVLGHDYPILIIRLEGET